MDGKELARLKDQRTWIDSRLQSIQEGRDYCSISIRIEKGNITVFRVEKTELVPKNFINK